MKKGFVMLTVIMMLFFIGTMLFVLTGVSNKITFQTNRAYLEAVRQNMISSGLSFAKYNIEKENIKNIELDTAGLGATNAQLIVTMGKITNKQANVDINTSCGFGSQRLDDNKKYFVVPDKK
ncbi:MAG: hypothetical protein WC496_12350 [Phycisphaerae bacterium]